MSPGEKKEHDSSFDVTMGSYDDAELCEFIGTYIQLILCFYHVPYAFQSEPTIYSYLNVKELLARSRREILSLRDGNWTRTHNNLVHKRTLNHLAKKPGL